MTSIRPQSVLAFPDANVLLHGKPLQSIPWSAVLDAPDVVLVLASSVLGELDQKMHDGPAALPKASTAASQVAASGSDRGYPSTP